MQDSFESYQQFKGIEIAKNENELDENLEFLKRDGYFIVTNFFSDLELITIRKKMDQAWEDQKNKYGEELLKKIGDWGQIRGMMLEDEIFSNLIIHPSILKYVDATIGDTAILHLQNGIVLHPSEKHNQAKYHKDFPKDFISSKILSFNAFIAVDEFNADNGGTWILPGSHKFAEMPSQAYIKKNQIQIKCPAGSVIFFDSTLWHKGGDNYTKNVRRAINQQYSRPFIKQQLDYPVMMKGKVDMESKLAQKLGMWTIPPKGVDEYRVNDPKLRTYRGGQG